MPIYPYKSWVCFNDWRTHAPNSIKIIILYVFGQINPTILMNTDGEISEKVLT